MREKNVRIKNSNKASRCKGKKTSKAIVVLCLIILLLAVSIVLFSNSLQNKQAISEMTEIGAKVKLEAADENQNGDIPVLT